MTAAVGAIAIRPVASRPVRADQRRGRLRNALHWVVGSPARMFLLIALVVGAPVSVLGQVLVDNAQRASSDAELQRVSNGAIAGAGVVADQVADVVARTRSIASTTALRTLIANSDAAGIDNFMAELIPLYANDISSLFMLTPTGELVAGSPPPGDLRGP